MVTGNGYTQSICQLDPSPAEEDPRAKCYPACFDYIKMKKPTAVLLEQVPGVVRNKKLRKLLFIKWMNVFLGIITLMVALQHNLMFIPPAYILFAIINELAMAIIVGLHFGSCSFILCKWPWESCSY